MSANLIAKSPAQYWLEINSYACHTFGFLWTIYVHDLGPDPAASVADPSSKAIGVNDCPKTRCVEAVGTIEVASNQCLPALGCSLAHVCFWSGTAQACACHQQKRTK